MSSRRTICFYVNGILTLPGVSSNWNRRAVDWTQQHTACNAEAVEYLSGALFSRWVFQRSRARKLRSCILRYVEDRWNVVLVGHSNGCDVILDCLRLMQWPRIEALHLISAACDSDCDRNGLNEAYRRGRIGQVSIYRARRDWALLAANTLTARLLFGYGALGRTGPEFAKFPHRLVDRDFGHGDWFAADQFESTMREIHSAQM